MLKCHVRKAYWCQSDSDTRTNQNNRMRAAKASLRPFSFLISKCLRNFKKCDSNILNHIQSFFLLYTVIHCGHWAYD